MQVDDFDDSDFEEIEPSARAGTKRADLVMKVFRPRLGSIQKMQFNVATTVLEEVGALLTHRRCSVAWSASKKAFRIKIEEAGKFEIVSPPKGNMRGLIRAPLPIGVFDIDGEHEPEFYVDAVGKQIIVECPEAFLTPPRKLLPPPEPKPAPPPAEPKREAPRNPGAPLDDPKVIRAALGISDSVPTLIAGQKFSPAEAAIVDLLARRELVTKQAALMATTEPGKEDEDDRDEKIIDVYMHKIRGKLGALQIELLTAWGEGWKLLSADRARLRAFIQDARSKNNG